MKVKVLILIAARLLLLPATFCQSGKSSSGIGWGGNGDRLCCGSQMNLLFLLAPKNCEPKGRARSGLLRGGITEVAKVCCQVKPC